MGKKKDKDKYAVENAIANALALAASTDENFPAMRTVSYCHSDFPGPANHLIAAEQAINEKIGMPEGWTEPITPHTNFFTFWVNAYLANTPSIAERRAKLLLQTLAELGKRQPPFAMDSFSPDEELTEDMEL